MLAASLEKARGRAQDLDQHIASLNLPAALAANIPAKFLQSLSRDLTGLDSQIELTQSSIAQLEERGVTKEEFTSLRDRTLESLQNRTQKLSIALIEQLEPSQAHLEKLEAELTEGAKNYFAAIADGDTSSIMKLIAELFQSLLDKIGIMSSKN